MSEAIRCEDSRKGECLLGLLGYYEAILERKGLVARIGEIRSLKLGLILDLLKMVSIAENDLCPAIIEFRRCKGFHNTMGSHRHKNRRFHNAMIRLKTTGPGQRIRICCQNLKFQSSCCFVFYVHLVKYLKYFIEKLSN